MTTEEHKKTREKRKKINQWDHKWNEEKVTSEDNDNDSQFEYWAKEWKIFRDTFKANCIDETLQKNELLLLETLSYCQIMAFPDQKEKTKAEIDLYNQNYNRVDAGEIILLIKDKGQWIIHYRTRHIKNHEIKLCHEFKSTGSDNIKEKNILNTYRSKLDKFITDLNGNTSNEFLNQKLTKPEHIEILHEIVQQLDCYIPGINYFFNTENLIKFMAKVGLELSLQKDTDFVNNYFHTCDRIISKYEALPFIPHYLTSTTFKVTKHYDLIRRQYYENLSIIKNSYHFQHNEQMPKGNREIKKLLHEQPITRMIPPYDIYFYASNSSIIATNRFFIYFYRGHTEHEKKYFINKWKQKHHKNEVDPGYLSKLNSKIILDNRFELKISTFDGHGRIKPIDKNLEKWNIERLRSMIRLIEARLYNDKPESYNSHAEKRRKTSGNTGNNNIANKEIHPTTNAKIISRSLREVLHPTIIQQHKIAENAESSSLGARSGVQSTV